MAKPDDNAARTEVPLRFNPSRNLGRSRKEESVQPSHQDVHLRHVRIQESGSDGSSQRLARCFLPRQPRVNNDLWFVELMSQTPKRGSNVLGGGARMVPLVAGWSGTPPYPACDNRCFSVSQRPARSVSASSTTPRTSISLSLRRTGKFSRSCSTQWKGSQFLVS